MTLTPCKLSNELSINLIGPNDELPNFADITRDIQNWASCWVRLVSMEAQLFCKFFGTSMRVIEIMWEPIVPNKLQPWGGGPEHLLWML